LTATPVPTTGPADRHRVVAAAFTATVAGTPEDAWSRPAPPEGWVARDVVRHLLEWFPAFLAAGTGHALPAGASADDEPLAAWTTQAEAVQALLDDPAVAEVVHDLPHLGSLTLAEAVDRIYTTDVFLHRWDLARATGQDESLDPAECERLLAGMEPMDEVLRQSGHYGPRVEVADDAAPQTRLLAFLGRTP
jgi:uncharacterized protein (TIGR03086 family)